jgi:hypothetical protein
MTTLRQAAQQALEALKYNGAGNMRYGMEAITALEEALEQPEQEPIGWLDGDETLAEFMHKDLKAAHDRRGSATPREFTIPVYLAPPTAQRKKEHITNGDPCWCNPEIDYVDPETGVAVIVHKEPQ